MPLSCFPFCVKVLLSLKMKGTKMIKSTLKISGAITLMILVSGCSAYRAESNIKPNSTTKINTNSKVVITEKALPSGTYKMISPIKVSVKKLTAGHKNPTKEQANTELIKSARIIGADTVMNVQYKSGIGFSTWGYMDASGQGVKTHK